MRSMSADRALANGVRVEMSAIAALDRVCAIVVADQESLHLSQFERPQHTAQTGHAEVVALRLVQNLADEGMPAMVERFAKNPRRLLSDLIIGRRGELSREAAHQPLLYVRMQVRLELRPMRVLAADDQLLPQPLLCLIFKTFRYDFEVVHDFIGNAALGMPGIIAVEAVASATPRQVMREAFPALGKLVKTEIEEPRTLAIH